MEEHRKRRKAYNVPGHAHELTCSCYRRRPFFADDANKLLFLESLDRARKVHDLLVWAYVIMPEHVHVLVRPVRDAYDISAIMKSIEQPVGQRAIARAKQLGATAEFKTGSGVLRFWQAGGGYDRNLRTAQSIWASIRYIHLNPVERGLVQHPSEYEWSSYNAYRDREDVPFVPDFCEVWKS